MKLGTSSLRRQMQAKHHLNAKNIVNLSGNVDTRLEKLYRGEYDCIILAKAGLERLGLLDELSYQEMTWSTASGQGFLGIEILNDLSDEIDHSLVHSLNVQQSHLGRWVSIEREILDEKDNYTVFKVLGDTQEIENLLSELKKEEFLEVTRSGTLGMTKGNESLATNDQTKISYD